MADIRLDGTVVLGPSSSVSWSGRTCPSCRASTLELDHNGTVFEYCSAAGCTWGIGHDVIVAGPDVVCVSHRFGVPS